MNIKIYFKMNMNKLNQVEYEFDFTNEDKLTIDYSLYFHRIPVELRKIIVHYYDNIGFAEYELYYKLLEKSKSLRNVADTIYAIKKYGKTYQHYHEYFDLKLFNFRMIELSNLEIKILIEKELTKFSVKPYLLIYVWEKFKVDYPRCLDWNSIYDCSLK